MTVENIHTLDENDAWFIDKGWIDSLSRSRFKLGDEVVVCDKRHGMLAKYYQGHCHTCKSSETIPFSSLSSAPSRYKFVGGRLVPQGLKISIRRSVRTKPQEVTQNVSANSASSRGGMLNFCLGVILILLITAAVLMNYYGIISNDKLLENIREVNNIISLQNKVLVSKFLNLHNISIMRLQEVYQLILQLFSGV